MSTDGGSISRHQNQAPALPPDTQLTPNLMFLSVVLSSIQYVTHYIYLIFNGTCCNSSVNNVKEGQVHMHPQRCTA